MLANTHDVLVHTATNFISNQTGLYPDRTGITQSNSFSYYDPAGATHTGVSFAYWTDPLYDPSRQPGRHPVQPRVHRQPGRRAEQRERQRAGAVGAVHPRGLQRRRGRHVEHGAGEHRHRHPDGLRPELAAGGRGDGQPDQGDRRLRRARGALRARARRPAPSGQTDALPDEPGGYPATRRCSATPRSSRRSARPARSRRWTARTIADAKGNPGFPGFDSLTPNNSLGYAATLLEHGVQVDNVYISDVHGDHTAADTGDLGPGEQTYEQQLHDYDTAFGQFFARLAADGITPANTLFSVTTDEGDHFSGSAPTPAGCTGLPGNYCTYTTKSEVNVNLPGLLATQRRRHDAVRDPQRPGAGALADRQPGPERRRRFASSTVTSAGLPITNPLTGDDRQGRLPARRSGRGEDPALRLAPTPARTPTLTAFSGEDEYVGSGAHELHASRACTPRRASPGTTAGSGRTCRTSGRRTPGRGCRARGVDRTTWADQTDTRPTLLALAGLQRRLHRRRPGADRGPVAAARCRTSLRDSRSGCCSSGGSTSSCSPPTARSPWTP